MLAGRRNFPNPPTATRPDLQKPQRASEFTPYDGLPSPSVLGSSSRRARKPIVRRDSRPAKSPSYLSENDEKPDGPASRPVELVVGVGRGSNARVSDDNHPSLRPYEGDENRSESASDQPVSDSDQVRVQCFSEEWVSVARVAVRTRRVPQPMSLRVPCRRPVGLGEPFPTTHHRWTMRRAIEVAEPIQSKEPELGRSREVTVGR